MKQKLQLANVLFLLVAHIIKLFNNSLNQDLVNAMSWTGHKGRLAKDKAVGPMHVQNGLLIDLNANQLDCRIRFFLLLTHRQKNELTVLTLFLYCSGIHDLIGLNALVSISL